jgi:hypothetical protein
MMNVLSGVMRDYDLAESATPITRRRRADDIGGSPRKGPTSRN